MTSLQKLISALQVELHRDQIDFVLAELASHDLHKIADEFGGVSKSKSDQQFDKFWLSYPLKKSKGDAKKAWKSVKADQYFEEIMISLPHYILSVHHSDWQNFAYPATWLRGHRWEDEITDRFGDPLFAGVGR